MSIEITLPENTPPTFVGDSLLSNPDDKFFLIEGSSLFIRLNDITDKENPAEVIVSINNADCPFLQYKIL